MARTIPAIGDRRTSPASAQVTVLALIVAGFAIAGLDPLTNNSAAMTGFGAVGLMALLAITSLAVLVFFLRRGERGWAVTVAPALATAGLAARPRPCRARQLPTRPARAPNVINNLPWLHLLVIAAALDRHRRCANRPTRIPRWARPGSTDERHDRPARGRLLDAAAGGYVMPT